MTYTSRSRVEAAINHIEPDRVPCDLTIVTKPYQELLEYFSMKEDDLWWDDWGHVFPKPEVLEKLHIDVFHIPYGKTAKGYWDQYQTEFYDEWGCKKVRVEDQYGGFLFQMVGHPLKDAETIADIDNYNWPSYDEPRVEGLEEYVSQLYKDTDFALTITFGGNVFERSHYLRGMDEFFVDLLVEPERAKAVLQHVLDINLHRNKQVLKAVGKYITYFRFNGEDLGSQFSPLISPNTFREIVKPYLEEEWRQTKAEFLKYNPNGKIAIHSCGAIRPFIPDFVGMGADILNPLQPNATGMDVAEIKNTFGNELAFHGAIDSQGIIVNGTVDEIIEEVKTKLDKLKKNGGYIAAPSHNIQSGVSPEKVVAIYETIHEYGKYDK